ncbi:MAG: molecular chaperone DnaJ [Candidatus Saccharimonadaceae bacterium]
MSKRDYYEVLGVSKTASADELKKAYRRLAVQHHPDKEGGSEDKFKELNEAYDILKDAQKRQRYDQFGHAGVGGASGGGGGNPFEGFGGGGGQNANFDFGGGFGDIFDQFFGGGGSSRQQGPKRGRDVEVQLQLTFEEAIFGLEHAMTLDLEDTCEHCKGTTVEPGYEMKTCPTCHGAGQQTRVMNTMFGAIQQTVPCETCHGAGQIPDKLCSVCHGSGTKRKKQTINVKIPAGVDDGATIRLSKHGEAVGGGDKGDLYIHIRVKADKKYTREGDIILSEEHISMVDAALGTEIEVVTVDGNVRMKVPAGTQSGTDFKLSGHGVPHLRNEEKRGPHIVSIVVDTPTKLSRKQREILEDLRSQN